MSVPVGPWPKDPRLKEAELLRCLDGCAIPGDNALVTPCPKDPRLKEVGLLLALNLVDAFTAVPSWETTGWSPGMGVENKTHFSERAATAKGYFTRPAKPHPFNKSAYAFFFFSICRVSLFPC